jgi:hypothetical protein
MNRFAKLSLAAAALSLAALSAMPASADVVINLRGKSAEQVKAEIHAAATDICRADAHMPLASLNACVDGVVQDTKNQLPASFGH